MKKDTIKRGTYKISVEDMYHVLTDGKVYVNSVVVKTAELENWEEITNKEMTIRKIQAHISNKADK